MSQAYLVAGIPLAVALRRVPVVSGSPQLHWTLFDKPLPAGYSFEADHPEALRLFREAQLAVFTTRSPRVADVGQTSWSDGYRQSLPRRRLSHRRAEQPTRLRVERDAAGRRAPGPRA